MISFKSLILATDTLISAMRRPYVLKANKRAFRSGLDSLYAKRIDFERQIDELCQVVRKEETIDVVKLVKVLEDQAINEDRIVLLEKFATGFFKNFEIGEPNDDEEFNEPDTAVKPPKK